MDPKKAALEYHRQKPPGKVEVNPTKSTATQRDLSLAYSPGVAEPCLEIQRAPETAFEYTARGNLVGVISNGTAVLGLGDIGALASKPVMEGKAVLFKRFAGIDVFDLEVDEKDPDRFIETVKRLGPTFGGINLEDIKAPDCYEIEQRLRAEMDIPVFHDDQHGTAIICGAALLNALSIVDKKIHEVRMVISGAGAAALSCARLFRSLGMAREHILMSDSRGILYRGREAGLNRYKEEFVVETSARTLSDGMEGADIFVGLSKGGLVTAAMLKTMASDPIVFALANPDPEISYPDALEARPDAIVGTGRSDFPNQINNVLGFPFIFRGALDTRATEINEAMKLAAVQALAQLAKEEVPESVSNAYGQRRIGFGREYLIPKPFDRRALTHVSSAVAKAAIESGVAQRKLDLSEYRKHLQGLLGGSSKIMQVMISRARRGQPCRIVFPEGEDARVLAACDRIVSEAVGKPVLLGSPKAIRKAIEKHGFSWSETEYEIVDPKQDSRREGYTRRLYQLRKYKGLSMEQAEQRVRQPIDFGLMMVEQGDAEGLLAGINHSYPETLRPALQIIRVHDWLKTCSGVYIIAKGEQVHLFADTTVNVDPSPEDLAEIAICAAEVASQFGITPYCAMLSFSNDGSTIHPRTEKMQRAIAIARDRYPELRIVGEIQADAAIDPRIRAEVFPNASYSEPANVLIFPDLDSANIAYKLAMTIGEAEGLGPVILGLKKPVNVIAQGSDANDIFNMAVLTVVKAQAEGETL